MSGQPNGNPSSKISGGWEDEDLLSISGLQHLMFCERQWALIHMEQEWNENVLTVEGRQLHQFVHEQGSEVRAGTRMVRGLWLRSLTLGLYGVADLVEFHPFAEGAILPGVSGKWLPYPVEYKRGRKRYDRADEVQLCAQGLCLEEMLGVSIPRGAVYYGQPRRRSEIELSAELRGEVERICHRARELYEARRIPPPRLGRHCLNCSLENVCMPQLAAKDQSSVYVRDILKEISS